MWSASSIDLDDERSLYLKQGGEGPDLVLIHGALATHQDWLEGPAEAFLPDYRVTLVDRPGHGLSRRPRFSGTPRDQADQIAAGLQRAGVTRAAVIGHSFGGIVALALAERHPVLVAGLVLAAPLCFPEPRLIEHGLLAPRSVPVVGPLLSRIASGSGFDRLLLDYAQAQMFAPDAIPQRWKASFPVDQVLDPDTLVAEGEDAASILPMSPAGIIDFKRISLPVEIITGQSDRILAGGWQGDRLAGLLPNARLNRIEGAGHMIHHSHPASLAEALRAASATIGLMDADFLVIGGGVAGLSAAARLARHGKVIVVEGESALGYHSSGRSVSFSHYGIGNAAVRGLTAWSRAFFEDQPEGFWDGPISRLMTSLYFADEAGLDRLDALGGEMAQFTHAIEPVGAEEMRRLCPVLRTGDGGALRGLVDRSGLKLDANAMLQGFARIVRAHGGEVLLGRRVDCLRRSVSGWTVSTEAGESWCAPVIVDAAGAWADRIAAIAGLAPFGLQPKRRTIIVLDRPAGSDASAWPFVLSALRDFYMLPEAGQILVSPVDEVDDVPCDAQPEEYDIALAADRVEHYTSLKVTRVAHRWAGLRSFLSDGTPTAGFAAEAPGFFWLLGQGGYGLQTAPAMAAIVESLVTGSPWPDGLAGLGVTPDAVGPERLQRELA